MYILLPWYTGCVLREVKNYANEHRSMKSNREENMQTTHSSHPVKQGKQKEPFQSNNGMLLPLNSLKISFSQIVHIIHNKIASQINAAQC